MDVVCRYVKNTVLGDNSASMHLMAWLDDEAVVECALSLGADKHTNFSARIVDGVLKICPIKLLSLQQSASRSKQQQHALWLLHTYLVPKDL